MSRVKFGRSERGVSASDSGPIVPERRRVIKGGWSGDLGLDSLQMNEGGGKRESTGGVSLHCVGISVTT